MDHFCNIAGARSLILCSPLQSLKEEHQPLREQMEKLYRLSHSIEEEKGIGQIKERILYLRQGVVKFVSQLDPHSEKEEGVLFPMVARYIGKDTGPILVMEYEHDQAKAHLRQFLEETTNLQESLTRDELVTITKRYNDAFKILQGHFLKEEEILFPLAQRLLSDEEKLSLEERIGRL
ncbi:hemerythrin domain-containing protein [Alkalihalobacillus sp. MEB130]|uniref:hemerythrin domain-containing protein n=1 Tax=Alkalihalobacillus sp. MEB130 TaxID=2976704 RepID=UPI0028DD40C9|nr:hemerythrin domain-containing protein [Alkalihalobacillus sp. MEB130]MDT8861393.1 hemerythrin domain-containing protein [Alkalihalobacillus sp. MEB130]